MTDLNNTNTTNGASSSSLKAALEAALPLGSHFKIRHLHSRPKRCEPLFSPLTTKATEKTKLAQHFLTISISKSLASPDPDSSEVSPKHDVLVLAIEALVYTTATLATIFVSKADSTGYHPQGRPSHIKTISTTFLRWLSNKVLGQKPSRKLVISLFGRAQGQYLFPGSVDNPRKHVLDDRQLIKWWVQVLNPLCASTSDLNRRVQCRGYITVPGYRGIELKQFLPNDREHWTFGNPLQDLAKTRGLPEYAPTRCLLPRFPDDPKARFMLDLDDEVGLDEDAGASATTSPSKRKNGRWKNIHNLESFWEAMDFRQECSSGRVVGFLWVVFEGSPDEDDSVPAQASSPSKQLNEIMIRESSPHKRVRSNKKRQLSGPIVTRKARIKGGSDSRSLQTFEDGLSIPSDGYDQAMQTLLHLDFATLDVAIKSTQKWAQEVSSMSGVSISQWISEIRGQAALSQETSSINQNSINDLGGLIKKKRKSHDVATDAEQPALNGHSINMLGSTLVKKKPKLVN